MNEGREFDLLSDLSRLGKKYGPDVFDRLAEQLSKPEFVERLVALLSVTAQAARSVPGLRRKPTAQKEFRASLVAIAESDRERGTILVRLYDDLMAKAVLPAKQDLSSFAIRAGLGSLEIHSRPQAVVAILDELRERSSSELKELVAGLNSTAQQNDRSLENWTRIILDNDLRTRKAQ